MFYICHLGIDSGGRVFLGVSLNLFLGLLVRIPLTVCMLVPCVLHRQRPPDDITTRSEKSYRVCVCVCLFVCVCLIVCDLETSTMRRSRPNFGCCVTKNILKSHLLTVVLCMKIFRTLHFIFLWMSLPYQSVTLSPIILLLAGSSAVTLAKIIDLVYTIRDFLTIPYIV